MKQAFYFLFLFAFCVTSVILPVQGQDNVWTEVGPTETTPSTTLNCYKLLQVNSVSDRYASIIEVSVQADPNNYTMQGTYRIHVNKDAGTSGRFDGLEIQSIMGNPAAATFYIYNNAMWIRSNFLKGTIYYRTEGLFSGNNPLNTAPFGKTVTVPTGYASSIAGGVKCDFDNNVFTRLPATDYTGTQNFYEDIQFLGGSRVGVSLWDSLSYDNKPQPHYGFQWVADSWKPGAYSFWLSGAGGIKLFTGGIPRLVIASGGNVGIGTTTPGTYKLAVEGSIRARRVKVDQETWADFVFEPEYKLPSLQEVEAYIKEHKHLPDVPSAADVAKERLDLGEMNKILLQKIEELTLHLIEQDKVIQEQKIQAQQQQEQMKLVKEKVEKLELR